MIEHITDQIARHHELSYTFHRAMCLTTWRFRMYCDYANRGH